MLFGTLLPVFFKIVIFNGATEGPNYGNMEKVDTKFMMNVGRIRVVFLNRFVSNLLVGEPFSLHLKRELRTFLFSLFIQGLVH